MQVPGRRTSLLITKAFLRLPVAFLAVGTSPASGLGCCNERESGALGRSAGTAPGIGFAIRVRRLVAIAHARKPARLALREKFKLPGRWRLRSAAQACWRRVRRR